MAALGKETITKAAELLQQASTMLLSVNENLSETNSRLTATNAGTPGTSAATAFAVPELRDTLARAKSMLAASSNAGLYRRLNKNERLRAAAGKSSSSSLQGSSSSKKEKPLRSSEKKPFEFALLRAPEVDSDGEEKNSLRKDYVINKGIITLTPSDTEKLIRDKIVSSLKPRYPVIENRDFEFVKLGKGTQYDYSVVKKLAGQGLLYIRMKQAMQFAVDEDIQVEDDMADDPFLSLELPSPFNSPTTSLDLTGAPSDCNLVPIGPPVRETPLDSEQFTLSPQSVQEFGPVVPEIELSPFFSTVIDEIPSTVSDPTEMLRFLQKKILLGRDLDVSDVSSELSGDTNYISFYGEQAEDRGGPRKEWIRLCNQKIQPKYFEQGLKEHLASDYFYIGQMAAIALLQNGQLPVYIPETVLQNVFYRPSENSKLSVKRLLHLLILSEKGSNSLKYEKSAYAHFVKYVREVASGRRVTKLENILEFATCASEEPLLGFALSPSIEFVEATLKT
ncbi:leucine-rich repeat-containing DDB_G0290503 isoform X1, partial [Paramuricea clavata]